MIVGVRRDGISFGAEFTLEIAARESKVLMLEIQPPIPQFGRLLTFGRFTVFWSLFKNCGLAHTKGLELMLTSTHPSASLSNSSKK